MSLDPQKSTDLERADTQPQILLPDSTVSPKISPSRLRRGLKIAGIAGSVPILALAALVATGRVKDPQDVIDLVGGAVTAVTDDAKQSQGPSPHLASSATPDPLEVLHSFDDLPKKKQFPPEDFQRFLTEEGNGKGFHMLALPLLNSYNEGEKDSTRTPIACLVIDNEHGIQAVTKEERRNERGQLDKNGRKREYPKAHAEGFHMLAIRPPKGYKELRLRFTNSKNPKVEYLTISPVQPSGYWVNQKIFPGIVSVVQEEDTFFIYVRGAPEKSRGFGIYVEGKKENRDIDPVVTIDNMWGKL